MLNRRRFLLGTAALLITGGGVGAIELSSHPYERWRLFHKLGLTSSHDYQAPPSGAVQASGQLASRYMGRAVDWTISTPGAYAGSGMGGTGSGSGKGFTGSSGGSGGTGVILMTYPLDAPHSGRGQHPVPEQLV